MQLSDFDYELPPELIAQEPIEPRSASKLMFLRRKEEAITHHIFSNILDLIPSNSLLVMNNTRVIPARIICKKPTGGEVELFLTRSLGNDVWECLLKPAKRVAQGGEIFSVNGKLKAVLRKKNPDGLCEVQLFYSGDFWSCLDVAGQTPIPPYVKNTLKNDERYQTVYSKEKGSVAAPTAGLHFTPNLLKELSERGVEQAYVTLHVGPGTFRPVKCDNITEHEMDREFYSIPDDTAKKIESAKKDGRKVIAVGTTSVRTLESAWRDGHFEDKEGSTCMFIYPGYKFKLVEGLITNFHLPKSTLIMLASAFAGKEFLFKAYEEAIREKYRMYSFGDAMLIL